MTRTIVTLLLTGLLALTAPQPTLADEPIRLATGTPEGNYAKIGEAMAKVLQEGGLKVELTGTAGSLANLNLIQEGKADFALCQFEILASMSEILFSPRMVLYIYPEPVHVLVREGSEIQKLGDLKGKKVDIGPDGSGTTSIALRLTRGQGIELSTDATVSQSSSRDALRKLLAGELDAMFLTTAYPSSLLTKLEPGKVRLLTWTGEELLPMKGGGVVSFSVRKDRHYGWRDGADWNTPAAICMLVASSKVSEETVQRVAELVYGHWGQLSRENEAWRYASSLDFGQDDLFTPSLERFVHPGALAFHRARKESEADVGRGLNLLLSGELEDARKVLSSLTEDRWDGLHPAKRHTASTFLMYTLLQLEQEEETLRQGARLHERFPEGLVSFADMSNDGATGEVADLRSKLRAAAILNGRGVSIVYLHNASERAVRLQPEKSQFEVVYGYETASSSVGSLSGDGEGALGGAPGWLEIPAGQGALLRSSSLGGGLFGAMLPDTVNVLAAEAAGNWSHLIKDGYNQSLEKLVVRCPTLRWGETELSDVVLIDYAQDR